MIALCIASMVKLNRRWRLATIGLCLCAPVAAQQNALVGVDEVVMQPFTQTVAVVGKLAAKQSGAVTARIAGTVAAMHAQLGERVARGQPLVTLDRTALDLQVALARARHAEAESRLALARQEAKRLGKLRDSSAVSRAAFDDAVQRRDIAAAAAEAGSVAAGGAARRKSRRIEAASSK